MIELIKKRVNKNNKQKAEPTKIKQLDHKRGPRPSAPRAHTRDFSSCLDFQHADYRWKLKIYY